MKVFTTGQVAKICKVAPRTVSKWFDSGRLRGYRIPGSQDRRIPREYLIRFLKEHGMPLGDLEDEAMAKVLIVAQDQVLIENLKRELPVERFCTAPGRTALGRGEFLVGLRLPPPRPRSGAHYQRFISRNEMDIAVVGVGAAVTLDESGPRYTSALDIHETADGLGARRRVGLSASPLVDGGTDGRG